MRASPFYLALLTIILVGIPEVSRAGWGPSGCVSAPAFRSGTVFLPSASAQPTSTYRWVPTSNPDQTALYLGNTQIGNWYHAENVFKELRGDEWVVATSPVGAPSGISTEAIEQNYGLDVERIKDAGKKYWKNGVECSKREAFEAVGSVPDDSGLLRLTVISSDAAKRQKVLADLETAPELVPWKGKLVIQDYPPDHWAVKDVGFDTSGDCRVVFQAAPDADGKAAVLHSQPDYKDGAAGLAEALRKADPSYQPDKDKDRRKPDSILPSLDLDLNSLLPWLVVAGLGAFAAFNYFRKPQ